MLLGIEDAEPVYLAQRLGIETEYLPLSDAKAQIEFEYAVFVIWCLLLDLLIFDAKILIAWEH